MSIRIALTSDIHVDTSQKNRNLLPYLAEEINMKEPDALIICGDISPGLEALGDALWAFHSVKCRKFFVAGNHDVWTGFERDSGKTDSFIKYNNIIPEICLKNEFDYLNGRGFLINGYGIAGGMGWYDFSLRNEKLDEQITIENYNRGRYRNLQWNDVIYTKWHALGKMNGLEEEVSPSYICEWMADSLRKAILEINGESPERILMATHFIPLKSLLRYSDEPVVDFACAYLGSDKLGEILNDFPSITHWFCGHVHKKFHKNYNGVNFYTNPVGYLKDANADYQDLAKESILVIDLNNKDEK